MNQVKIGKFISEHRKKQGYLQKDIAARLGISEKTVSKWECGNGLPEVIYMEPLCRLLGITVNELLAGEAIPILVRTASAMAVSPLLIACFKVALYASAIYSGFLYLKKSAPIPTGIPSISFMASCIFASNTADSLCILQGASW